MNNNSIEKTITNIISEWNKKVKLDKEYMNLEALTLSSGLPGVILLLLESCGNQTKNYDKKILEYIDYMVRMMSKRGVITDSLYSGAAGIGLSIFTLAKKDINYNKLLNSINEYIDYSVRQRINKFNRKRITPMDYDVIEGLSGILVYLLLIDSTNLVDLKKMLVNFLVSVIEDNKSGVPLYVSSENQMSQEESKLYPRGCLNLGLAHGMAGVGIVLAYSISKGYGGDKVRGALRKIISLYENFELTGSLAGMWKDGIEEKEYREGRVIIEPKHLRDAWCYGSPGISLLYLYVGIIENSEYLKTKAQFILLKAIKRRLGVDTGILCHGEQGLVEICLLLKKLLKIDLFDEYIWKYPVYQKKNSLAFLDGEVGIVLSKLHLHNKETKTFWRHALLLFEDFEELLKIELLNI